MTTCRCRVRPIMLAAPLILTSLIAVLLATAADATPPGDNGRVAFRRYLTARNGCCDPRHVKGAIFTASADGSGERQLTFPRKGLEDDEFPDWSPDGNHLAFERCTVKGCHIWTIASDRTRQRRLGPTTHLKPNDNEEDPAYSPNGKLIAFDHIAGPIRRGKLHGVQGIFTMRTDGTHFRQVTQRGRVTPRAEDRTPQWSPDGKSIVFARENVSARPKGGRALFTVHADGTASPHGALTPAEWAPAPTGRPTGSASSSPPTSRTVACKTSTRSSPTAPGSRSSPTSPIAASSRSQARSRPTASSSFTPSAKATMPTST